MSVAISFFAILVFFAAIIAVVAVVLVLTLRRRRIEPRGFDVMERERHENQP
jgi:hypothetical protein